MEPPDKGKSDESLSKKNRDLLRLEAQEKRRREAPGEKDQFPGKTPIFAKPYKTDNKDALSRRIRNILGDYNDFKEYMRKNLRKVIWLPKKIKSRSQTRSKCREPSSRQTKTFQSSVTEQPLKNSKTSESSELEPFLEKTNSTDAPSIEDILREMTFTFSRPVSPLQSPPKAEPSSTKQTNSTDVPSIEDILREMTFTFSRPVSPLQSPPKAEPSSTKQTNSTDVPSIEDILREMTFTFSRPVSPLHSPPKAEPAKLPCSTKDTDGSAAQNQVSVGSKMFLSSVTVRRVMTTRFLKSLLLHLLLQDTVSVGFQLSLSSVTARRVMTIRFLNSHLLHMLLQDTVSVGFQLSLSSVTARRVMTIRLLKGHLLHLLLQDTACSWMTCSSVTVRRAMTTKLLKSLLLHLFLQETVLAHGGHAFPYSPSPGVWHQLCPAAQSQGAAVTQRAPQAWRPAGLWESKGLASPWCTMGPRGTGRTPIHWRSGPSLPGTDAAVCQLGLTAQRVLGNLGTLNKK
ncbi:AF4/FMR2 family member 1-like isoform X2 [Pseudopipra pipra]|uniref:AF4/FMR2 family member 1-like isoform X2 n=1 Tax=Pseudopipra pipra TaxID=415032 RepID=UPI0031395454